MADSQRSRTPLASSADHPSPSSTGPTGSGFGASPPPTASGSGSTPTTAGSQASKRKRGLGAVTPNACTECRKKRAKCDGLRPCTRCKSQKDVECVYEIPVRQSKENLRSEIEQLRHRQRSSDQVFAALARPELWEEVIQRLRSGQSVDSISEWLGGTLPSAGGALPSIGRPGRGGSLSSVATITGSTATDVNMGLRPGSPRSAQPGVKQDPEQNSPWHLSVHSQSDRSGSHPDMMNWSSTAQRGPPRTRVASWAEGSREDGQRYRGLDQVLSPLDSGESDHFASNWTRITDDANLVQHLLALYFCWEYPTFASLSKEHFVIDFQRGRHRYCSPILVNALLALGCRFSTQPSTRANPNDPYTSGDHFFKESQRLLYAESNHHSLTTIQALGIMSIREASCGRDSESWYYAGQSIRLAVEMGLHQLHDEGDQDELAVKAATFWGAFALDHAWSLATGSLPQCSCFPRLPPKPGIIDDIEASLWIPYTDDGQSRYTANDYDVANTVPGAPLQRSCEQPSNVRSVYKCFCELSELVHQSLYILHSPGRPLTSRDLLSIYTQYLNWYDRIPEVLRLGHNFTPAVLFAHMYYHFAILLLFRPLIKLRIIGSSVTPRDVCSQAADAIQGLLRSYSQLYTLKRTPSFVPYFVLTSSIMHLAIGASESRKKQSADMGVGERVMPQPGNAGEDKVVADVSGDPKVIESIKQGVADLTEMAPCHGFAEQALSILKYLANKWGIEVDVETSIPGGRGAGAEGIGPDGPDPLRPQTNGLNFFAPNFQDGDFLCAWGNSAEASHQEKETLNLVIPVASSVGGGGGASAGERTRTVAARLENPLFWPFPMQGRPMLPVGRGLEEAGFAFL